MKGAGLRREVWHVGRARIVNERWWVAEGCVARWAGGDCEWKVVGIGGRCDARIIGKTLTPTQWIV